MSNIINALIHKALRYGDVSILNHPDVDKVNNHGTSALHALACKELFEVLRHHSVDKVLDKNKDTPLDLLTMSLDDEERSLARSFFYGEKLDKALQYINHPVLGEFIKYATEKHKTNKNFVPEIYIKAYHGDLSILNDPTVSMLQNGNENSPLHILAFKKYNNIDVWKHPDFDKVKNSEGKTPFDYVLTIFKTVGSMTSEEEKIARGLFDGSEISQAPIFLNHPSLKLFAKFALEHHKPKDTHGPNT